MLLSFIKKSMDFLLRIGAECSAISKVVIKIIFAILYVITYFFEAVFLAIKIIKLKILISS